MATAMGAAFAAVLLAGLAGTSARAAEVPAEVLRPGDTVPAFTTERADGGPVTVDFSGPETTILVFFTSGCPHCHKMLPEWRLAYAKKPDAIRMIGVLMDTPPPGVLQALNVPFAVVRPPDRAFRSTYKVRSVPLTVRIGKGGVVEDVAVGVIDPIRLGEVMRPPR